MAAYARTLLALALVALIFSASVALSQTESATVSGRITDPSGAVVAGTEVQLQSIERGTVWEATSNNAGIYSFPSVQPGQYHMTVRKVGFRKVEFVGLVLNVQDHVEKNFQLQIGSISESITVSGGAPLVNTEDASVSTVVDRNFAENLPMNGRSFQTLIELTPGVVPATSSQSDGGQFNINGQRAASNYWSVDGVSANIGISASSATGNGLSGSLGSFSALGATSSLVSIDALQEFRIQTSTYAPEFGRSPGGQISILTRSGTNLYHGTVFDYLRNAALDANDWFADNAHLPKPGEIQNDFGGTFSGPIIKNKTFYFFSYEGLRLRLPETQLTTVPDLAARNSAMPTLKPYLDVFPLPNGSDDPTTGIGQFNASYSNPATLNAYSLRIDHRISANLSLFGRYNYSPSKIVQRGIGEPLSNLSSTSINTQTLTLGATWPQSSSLSNDIRFNYSKIRSTGRQYLDTFGGAVPLSTLPFPSPYTARNATFYFDVFTLNNTEYVDGLNSQNTQKQFNIVDNINVLKGSHNLKLGIDYRRLAPTNAPSLYSQGVFFNDLTSAETGNVDAGAFTLASVGTNFLFRNLGLFAQDTWQAVSRLTLTYGIRWDLDFVPVATRGPNVPAIMGFNLNNPSMLALAPSSGRPFNPSYGDVAPRVGLAFQISRAPAWQTVARGGFGIFYDLRDSEYGNLVGSGYPFASSNFFPSTTFPLPPAEAAPPAIAATDLKSGTLAAFDPHLRLPYTLQWNAALEQALGTQQTLTASYVGAAGRRLIQSAFALAPNANIARAVLVGNTGSSDYDALQVQFQRRLEKGAQALVSYTWAHSIDNASAGSIFGNTANTLIVGLSNHNRGSSDFDVRQVLSVGLAYKVPTPHLNKIARGLLRDWSLQNILQSHSALPVTVYDADFSPLYLFYAEIRPDVVPGQSLYIHGLQCPGLAGSVCPGNKAINPAAFVAPPTDPNTGYPLRQGNVGRNALRGFGLTQWDFSIHRDFSISEAWRLQYRAEFFNILNHPNFGLPQPAIGSGNFGQATQILSQSLGANVGGGGLSSLYQLGGPRSVQFALKVIF